MSRPPLNRLLDLQTFLLAFRNTKRVVHLAESEEYENDVDHSYFLAVTAWYLSEHFPELDQGEVIRIALAHDLVEVHAGDTYLYGDPKDLADKQEREAAAFNRIKQDWPDFTGLLDAIHDYETKGSQEAKFVYALDKIMPILMIYLGGGHTWRAHKITLAMLHGKKSQTTAISPEIAKYYQEIYKLLQEQPELFPNS